jgi:apolipoprotein N-acyltransferase
LKTRETGGALLAVLGGVMLAAATPPAWFPGAEFLVVGGLMAWFAIASAGSRPRLHTYLLGCVHMAWFSWSTRHILWPAYLAIVVLGGLYFVLGSMAVRALPRWLHTLGFGVAVGATSWLRAVMPEIHYPHGQPCHDFWQWPQLLGSLAIGGEPLANALLGMLAAAFVELWRSWRVAMPSWRLAGWQCVAVVAFALACSLPGLEWGETGGAVTVLRVAAIEPGIHPMDPYEGLSPEAASQRFEELFAQRLVEPTRQLLTEQEPPDLILWPESSLWSRLKVKDVVAARRRLLPGAFPDVASTRLLLGANLYDEDRDVPGALLVATDGKILGHQEKRCLVPGGEFLPFVRWLPDSVVTAIHSAFRAALGTPPDCMPGRMLPPLRTAGGEPFGVLMCYDNAFPGPGAEQVAAGAQFLCVLSNEAWFRRGGELTQLAAMTVCRAIELRTPIVRCTTDGWTLAVDASGRMAGQLPILSAPGEGSRILRTNLELQPARQRPMAWLRADFGGFLAVLLGAALLHGLLAWVRLRVARTALPVPVGSGEPRLPGRTGS